ncbi:MAG: YraN family protein [Alphaproteobacteria bacterium]
MNGKHAELFAKLVLRFKGYRIIDSNYITGKGTHAGEIDIVATKRKTIVFVEVKKRASITTALYAIKPEQQKRIYKGAEAYLKYHPEYCSYKKRIDAFFVASIFDFVHIKNAWGGS